MKKIEKIQRKITDSGWYRYIFRPPIPTKKQKEIAIRNTKINISSKELYAKCACCKKDTAVASDVVNISEKGNCKWCELYEQSKVDYVEGIEKPTLYEVCERAKKSLTLQPVETKILYDDYLKLGGIKHQE